MQLLIPNFSGIAPRFADRLLREDQASFVANLKPTSGDLRGFRSLLYQTNLPAGSTWRKALRFFYPGTDNFEWFLSTDIEADAVDSPLASDAFNRIYFTDNRFANPQITTLDDIANGVPSSNLGVPRPTIAPTVTTSGGAAPTETRVYGYVYVDKYGAVGPPSPGTLRTANSGSTWTITVTLNAVAERIDVFRSAEGSETSGQFYKIGEIVPPDNDFVDTMANDLVPFQPVIVSFNYDPPPPGLKGLTKHSSGALVAFKERTVYFSEPYLPHAWSENNRYVLQDEVVGIAVLGNSVFALTTSYPVILSGNRPDTIAIISLTDPEGCTSKRSVVVMGGSVIYTSQNGLVSVNLDGVKRPINALMTRDEFQAYEPDNVVAAAYGSYYIAFTSESKGFAVALPPYEPISFVPLDRYSQVTGLDTDSRTGDLYIIQTTVLSLFDRVLDRRFATTFRSKEFIIEKPVNFGAYQILFKGLDDTDADLEQIIIDASLEYNEARFAEGPLDTIAGYPIGGSIDEDFSGVDPILGGLPPIQPIGGEPLYDIDGTYGIDGIRFTMFVNGALKYSTLVSNELVHRLPSGFKATRYYFEISTALTVQRLVVAETATECKVA